MPLSCTDLRRTLRHPEEHPRHAVSIGRWAGALMTTSLMSDGTAEADFRGAEGVEVPGETPG